MKSTNVKEYARTFLDEHKKAFASLSEQDIISLQDGLINSKRIFMAGAGRTGYIVKTFCMRCMHMGLQVYMVGDTITPRIQKEDTLLIASGSGQTKSLVTLAEIAKEQGAKLFLLTSQKKSRIASMSDIVLVLPGKIKEETQKEMDTIQIMGCSFEQEALLIFDSLAQNMSNVLGIAEKDMMQYHTNLE